MAKSQHQKKAIVIGAGAGGIGTAARLAQAGFSVTVLEKNSFTGGRCSLIHHEGHRFDQGPSLLLLPKFFKEIFHELGTSLEAEGVELLRCPTNYNVWFSDGENFELSTDLARMKDQIEKWEGKDGFQRYLQWLGEAHQHYELSVSAVLRRNFTSLFDMATPAFIRTGLKLHPLHSIWGRASRYFWSERLRRVFTFATMYMGMSPFDAPATYSLLQYTELAEGIWYPRGGFQKVLAALQGVGERMGVEYRLDTPVEQILTHADGKTTRGVRLAGSGEELDADVVIVNADLVYAYNNLLPGSPCPSPSTSSPIPSPSSSAVSKFAAGLRRKPGSCSSISFYWSLSEVVPELQTHNIFLADQYRESFDSIFSPSQLTLPEEPSFYINVPSRIDPSAAPAGKDSVIALVPVGHLRRDEKGNELDWPSLITRARESVITTISARTGCRDLRELITHESVNDPYTWEKKFNLDKGSILGLSHSFTNVLAFRPQTRATVGGIRGLYFVGASTHPGTGVPIVLAGSKITSEQVLEDMGLPSPWRDMKSQIMDNGVVQRKGMRGLDRLVRPGVLGSLGSAVLLLVSMIVVVLVLMNPGLVEGLATEGLRMLGERLKGVVDI